MSETTIVRHKTKGAFAVKETRCGFYLAPAIDPDADADLTDEDINKFHVPPDFPRIPGDLWHRWVMLCFHFAPFRTGSLEVSVRLLVNATDDSQYRIVVPRQSVSMGSVHATNFKDSVDIVTGEPIDDSIWPPVGWLACGSSHSHGTMASFFSGVDDGNELGDPGIHITVGHVDVATMRYTMAASVTDQRKRFRIDYDKLINLEDFKGCQDTFHPNCLEYVDVRTVTTVERSLIPSAGFRTSDGGWRRWDTTTGTWVDSKPADFVPQQQKGGYRDWSKDHSPPLQGRFHFGQDGEFDYDNYYNRLPAYGSRYDKERLIGEMQLSDLTENLTAGLEYSIHSNDLVGLTLLSTQLEALADLISDVAQLLQLDTDEEQGSKDNSLATAIAAWEDEAPATAAEFQAANKADLVAQQPLLPPSAQLQAPLRS